MPVPTAAGPLVALLLTTPATAPTAPMAPWSSALATPATTPTPHLAPLPLAEAIAIGLAAHPRVHAATRLVDAARAREVQAAAAPNPNFALTVDQVPFSNPGVGNYMAGVTQPILPAPLREARVGIARVDRAISELDLAIARLDLAARIKAAYAHALQAGDALTLARDTKEHVRWLLRAAGQRWKAGDMARVEVLRAEVDAARAERAEREAIGAQADARARLNVLIGRGALGPLSLGPLAAPRADALPAIDVLLARALSQRVEFRRAGLAVEREALARQAARAGLWTGSAVSASLGAVSGQPGVSGVVSVPVPLYRAEGEIAEAEANRLAAEAAVEALRHDVTLEVEQARREAVLAADLAGRLARDMVPRAERFARNARERFSAGEGTGVDVAEAVHALHEARAERQRAELEWHEAIARLERAIGAAGPEVAEVAAQAGGSRVTP